MTHDARVKLTVNGGEAIRLAGVFDDDEWERLSSFCEYAEDLLSTKYIHDRMPGSLKTSAQGNSGPQLAVELPHWDDVVVFLHKLRPIYLQSEDTEFTKVCGVLGKRLAHPAVRALLKEQRRLYSGGKMQSAFRLRYDGVTINSEEVLYNWLNAYEYHRDRDKRKFIDSLHTMFPLDASKVVFLSLLGEKAIAIDNIAGLARVVLGQQEDFLMRDGD